MSRARADGGLTAVVRGSAVVLLGSLVGGTLGFLFSLTMARLLDRDDFGLLVLAMSFVTAGSAIGIAGTDTATVRFVASASTPERRRGAIVTPLLLALVTSMLLAAVLALAAPFAASHLGGAEDGTGALRAVAAVIPLGVLAVLFSAGLSGLEQTRGELARKTVDQAGRIVLASIGVLLGFEVVGAIAGVAVAAGLTAVVTGAMLLRALPPATRLERVPLRSVAAFSLPQTIARVATQLTLAANIAILSAVEGAEQVALFGAAIAISRLPSLVYNAFAFRFSPTVVRLWNEERHAELGQLLQRVTRAVALVSLPLYALPVALPTGLLELYGEDYESGAAALVVLAVAASLNALAGPVEWTLIMTGRVRLEMWANVAAGVAAIAAAAALTAPFGLVGAASAQIVWVLVMNGLKTAFAWRMLGLRAVSGGLLRPLLATGAAIGVAALGSRWLGAPSDVHYTVVLAAVLIVVYAGAVILLGGLAPDERRFLMRSLRPSR